MDRSEKLWAVLFGVLVVAAYAVPFVLLRGVHTLYGAALFWTVFALTVILLLERFTRSWRDPEEE